MTNEQELSLVKLYSAGVPYKVISDLLDVPTGTLASCIRRKYKDLQSQMQAKFRLLTENYTRKFMRELGVSAVVAQAMFGNLYERFQNKRRNTKVKEFTIRFSDIEYTTHCPLLGIPLNYNETNYRADDYPTYDRIDNSKGYVPGNVHIVSWKANRLKKDGTIDEIVTLATNLQKLKKEE
jgi:hypothetical protein